MSTGSGENLVRTRVRRAQPRPGTEEVLINAGLYHDSCLDGTLREVELREQRKRVCRGERGGSLPGDGQ